MGGIDKRTPCSRNTYKPKPSVHGTPWHQHAPLPHDPHAQAVAETFAAGGRATLCPKLNSSAPADALPRVTGPGCACNLTSDPAANRCPSGFRCSRSGYLALSADVLVDPVWAALGGVCVPCDAGQYCAEGVYVKVRVCAAGWGAGRGVGRGSEEGGVYARAQRYRSRRGVGQRRCWQGRGQEEGREAYIPKRNRGLR